MNEKNILPQVVWDILIFNFTMIMATINVLTYIFTAASGILLYLVIKDYNTYRKSEFYNKKSANCLMLAIVVSIVSIAILISLVATNKIYLTYVLYGLTSPVILVTGIYAIKDSIKTHKLKQQTAEVKTEDKAKYEVSELGTSQDRQNSSANEASESENNSENK